MTRLTPGCAKRPCGQNGGNEKTRKNSNDVRMAEGAFVTEEDEPRAGPDITFPDPFGLPAGGRNACGSKPIGSTPNA
ncbi:MAG: hypothetical protein IPL64_17275 [Flavobacteriales bacterium]|nr:hypothetical protein [Flavobacteriales bacterium]